MVVLNKDGDFYEIYGEKPQTWQKFSTWKLKKEDGWKESGFSFLP